MIFLGERGPVFAGAANGKAAKWLLEHYDAETCEACFADLESQKWRTVAVTWITVAKEIPQWINRRVRTKAKSRLGEWDGVESPNPFEGMTEDEIVERCRQDLGYYKD
jgi:hypothetical protein